MGLLFRWSYWKGCWRPDFSLTFESRLTQYASRCDFDVTLCPCVFELLLHVNPQEDLSVKRLSWPLPLLLFFLPLCSSLTSKGSLESAVKDKLTLATIMLRGNKLNRGRWKPNTSFEKWSWAEMTTQPESSGSRQEREPQSPARGVLPYFLSYNWKPWNTPWFVFFYK